jgi:hypothetical protein
MTAKIKLNAASGGGSFSLQAPSSSANTRVMTLPDTADGTILTTTNPKAGNIIQVVQSFKGDTFTTTSGTFVDVTGLSVSITPSSNSNKILVLVSVCGQGRPDYARNIPRLVRDSTPIGNSSDAGSRIAGFGQMYQGEDVNNVATNSIEFLDAPATTSSVTYKVQIVNGNNSGDVMCINRSYGDGSSSTGHRYSSSITAMEVAA